MEIAGERQVGKRLSEIDRSHLERYFFARRFVRQSSNILDYGTGVGYGAYILSHFAAHILAVDSNYQAIQNASKYFAKPIISYEVGRLPPKTGTFDLITCFELIEHVHNPFEILFNLYDRLAKDGIFLLSSPNEAVMPYDAKKFPFHVKHFTHDELSTMLKVSGFKLHSTYSQLAKHKPTVRRGKIGAFLILVAKKDPCLET